MQPFFSFFCKGEDTCSGARAGILFTPHGVIETPVFMPVGTQASVKSLSPLELRQSEVQIILANTYHLHLRPSDSLIAECGGLHRFENWDRPILTDSGGFQVFSLREMAKITDEGVWFQSHIDGSKHLFSPETVMQIEHNLGADIIMMFDECPPAISSTEVISAAVDRTILWARRCLQAHQENPAQHGYPQALFGIVQGGTSRELRLRCACELTAMNLPGYAIGGCAVGEAITEMYSVVEYTAAILPRSKPRYLMGVGKPVDILECISRGIDMFDCVLPTRNGRNGSVFTWQGVLNIRNAVHSRDFNHSLDDRCICYACRNFSRAYLRHLYMAGEILAIRMLTLHNIHFFTDLVRSARSHIIQGTFSSWKNSMISRLSEQAI